MPWGMSSSESSDGASPSTVEMGDHSAKKPRQEAPHGPVKQEIAVRQAAGAIVAAEHGPRVEAGLKVDATVLHCPLCFSPLKPPVFQCKAGHMACGGCLAAGCGRCEDGGAAFDVPNTGMDAVVSAAWMDCPHDGCEMQVTYHQVQEHRSSCPHVPCHCPEPGCGFIAPAAALVAHLAADHDMPVHKVPYGKVQRIHVTVPEPEPVRRLLVGAEDEGGAFLLTLAAQGTATVVTAVRIRGEACLSPRYTVKIWANGPPLATPAANRKNDTVLADFEATSSTTPGAVEFDDLTSYLTVPRRYLVGDGPSKELSLNVRIEKTTIS